MSATRFRTARAKRGSSLVVSLMLVVTIAGLALLLVSSSAASHTSARTQLRMTKAFYTAEGGIDYALSQMSLDPFWPARSGARFPTVEADGTFTSRWIPLGDGAGDFRMLVQYSQANALPNGWAGPGFPEGFESTTPVLFDDRANDTPKFDRIHVQAIGRYGDIVRRVSANVKLR